jgi:hypothetical protein
MHGASAVRVLGAASLGAVAAVVAHGGPSLLTDPRWLVPALAAAGACTWAAATAATLAARGAAPRPWSPWATIGLLLIAQTAAHAALLGVGVMPATGQTGSIALHVALALAAAALLSIGERLFASRARDVLRRLLELLADAAPQLGIRPCDAPRPALAAAPRRQRGPPTA